MKKQKGNLFVRDTVGDKIILTINFIALCLFLIIIAYPLLFVISASFSAGTATMSLSLIQLLYAAFCAISRCSSHSSKCSQV